MKKKAGHLWFIFRKTLRHRIRAGHRKGHGIHPPFAFRLVSEAVFGGVQEPRLASLTRSHRRLMRSRKRITVSYHGAGSAVTSKRERTIGSLFRRSSVRPRYGRLLYRLADWYRPTRVLELGCGLGISTAYIAMGCRCEVTAVEGSREKCRFARNYLSGQGLEHVDIIRRSFRVYLDTMHEPLPGRSMVFLDGDHRFEATVETGQRLLTSPQAGELMLVIDDIHWSPGMEKAWDRLRHHPAVDLSLDLFQVGILVGQPGVQKNHFRVNF